MPRHLLSAKDLTAREAVCSVCGPVTIRANGPAKWICVNKKRESLEDYRRSNPERVSLSRGKQSLHHLTTVDPAAGSGACPIDGTVPLVAIGRGWMCGVRAAEMGHRQDAPQPRCTLCGFWQRDKVPVIDGVCAMCLDTSTAQLVRATAPRASDLAALATRLEVDASDDGLGEYVGERGDGWAVENPDFAEYATEGWDYADPRLKTIGPPLADDDPWLADVREQRTLARKARERRWVQ